MGVSEKDQGAGKIGVWVGVIFHILGRLKVKC